MYPNEAAAKPKNTIPDRQPIVPFSVFNYKIENTKLSDENTKNITKICVESYQKYRFERNFDAVVQDVVNKTKIYNLFATTAEL